MAVLGAGASSRFLWGRASHPVLRTVTQPVGCWDCGWQAKRYLLTDEILKLREFQKKKLATVYHVYGKKDLYFQSINDKLQKNRIILRSELQTLLHLCQTPADVEFAKQVIYRYHEENKNVMFGEFKFGPIFIRLCYELDLEEAALELLKDQSLGNFFHDCTSYNILMDMLFTKGQYEGALEVLVQMRNQKVRFSKDTYILAFAICYKLNNSNSCKICTTLLDEIEMKGNWLPTQASCFAVAFALKQNDIAKARSIYSQIRKTDGRLCNNLNLLIKVHNNELEDVLQMLEAASESPGPVYVRKIEFSEQVMNTVGEKLKHTRLYSQFNQIYRNLKDSGQITQLTLDDMLCYTSNEHRHALNLLKPKKVSQRTFKSLQSALLAE
ncbi:pentatricopeptide repeat-containing protein 2, mitochondrial [Spea bombifrons]|uniref:pentatricopeptide repeat-containing protein 2, mitochondrial n=1 Tax=Spea bombifrons TaxID=233779 RepID=UPI00234AA7B7|nr:pentatricopeptide repeat-containing protein 2, mitochondrial [Spea bombifrons]